MGHYGYLFSANIVRTLWRAFMRQGELCLFWMAVSEDLPDMIVPPDELP